MTNLIYRSDIKVDLLHHYGTDRHIAEAAWVSSGVEEEAPTEKRVRGLINALMRDRHGTPFESGYFCFRVEAPRAVRDEAVRHRIASFSSSSLRYTLAIPEVYIPPRQRPIKVADGHKQIHPKYEPLADQEYDQYIKALKEGYQTTALAVKTLAFIGRTETEAQRWLSHDGSYVKFYMRLNPRSLMHFLGLRTHNENANHVSYPMWEINEMANQMESDFRERLPLTYEAWMKYGREAP